MENQYSQEILDSFRKYSENHKWAAKNSEKLRNYDGQYVAINDGKVLGSSLDKDELVEKYKNIKGVFIEFITPKDIFWIL